MSLTVVCLLTGNPGKSRCDVPYGKKVLGGASNSIAVVNVTHTQRTNRKRPRAIGAGKAFAKQDHANARLHKWLQRYNGPTNLPEHPSHPLHLPGVDRSHFRSQMPSKPISNNKLFKLQLESTNMTSHLLHGSKRSSSTTQPDFRVQTPLQSLCDGMPLSLHVKLAAPKPPPPPKGDTPPNGDTMLVGTGMSLPKIKSSLSLKSHQNEPKYITPSPPPANYEAYYQQHSRQLTNNFSPSNRHSKHHRKVVTPQRLKVSNLKLDCLTTLVNGVAVGEPSPMSSMTTATKARFQARNTVRRDEIMNMRNKKLRHKLLPPGPGGPGGLEIHFHK